MNFFLTSKSHSIAKIKYSIKSKAISVLRFCKNDSCEENYNSGFTSYRRRKTGSKALPERQAGPSCGHTTVVSTRFPSPAFNVKLEPAEQTPRCLGLADQIHKIPHTYQDLRAAHTLAMDAGNLPEKQVACLFGGRGRCHLPAAAVPIFEETPT